MYILSHGDGSQRGASLIEVFGKLLVAVVIVILSSSVWIISDARDDRETLRKLTGIEAPNPLQITNVEREVIRHPLDAAISRREGWLAQCRVDRQQAQTAAKERLVMAGSARPTTAEETNAALKEIADARTAREKTPAPADCTHDTLDALYAVRKAYHLELSAPTK